MTLVVVCASLYDLEMPQADGHQPSHSFCHAAVSKSCFLNMDPGKGLVVDLNTRELLVLLEYIVVIPIPRLLWHFFDCTIPVCPYF